MRASFQSDLALEKSYHLKGETLHHLLNVVRIEVGEELLLLNGQGLMVKTIVRGASKKEITLETLTCENSQRSYVMDLALGIPKKEALELSLKQAVELGFRKIWLIRSQYSQTRLPESDRIESILVSALEQSNAPFKPEIISVDWSNMSTSDYAEILLMDSQSAPQKNHARLGQPLDPRLLVVGPEGGFSTEELALLHGWPNIRVLKLPTPILRTPTAVATGAGIILDSLLD